MAQATLKYMVGTEGKNDYLVVEKRAKYSLGIKGLATALPNNYVFFGLRVRSGKPNADVIDSNKTIGSTEHRAKWNLPFSNGNNKRASVMLSLAVRNVDYKSAGSVYRAAVADGVVNVFLEFLQDRGTKSRVSLPNVRKFLATAWCEALGHTYEDGKKEARKLTAKRKPRIYSNVVYTEQDYAVMKDLKNGKLSMVQAKDEETFEDSMPKKAPKLKAIEGGKSSNVVSMAEVKAAKKASKAKKTKLKLVKKAAKKKVAKKGKKKK